MVKELGTQVSKQDTVEVDGVPIYQEEYGYYLFYKPRGVISAVSDDKGRKVVTDYLQMLLSEFIQSVVWIMILLGCYF